LTKAAPIPIFRTFTQSALHRIAVDVTEFLHKLAIVADVEIVIAFLPEMLGEVPTQANTGLEWGTLATRRGTRDQAARHSLLQRLESVGEQTAFRFADQQVNMLGHNDISVNAESETAPHTLQREFEDSLGGVSREQRSPMVTGECYEVAVPRFLKSFQCPRHEARLRSTKVPTQAKSRLEWGTVGEQVSDRETEN